MPTSTVQLPLPNVQLVQTYVERFDREQAVVESALATLYGLFPENTKLEDILLKVVTLNDLYRTGIYATYRVAEHIQRLNIDPTIQAGRSEAVDRIARVELGGKVRNNYSFATKYCAWHAPSVFPIYDSFVERMLGGYRQQQGFADFHRQDLWQYERFREVIEQFRVHFSLSAHSLRDIDKFFWRAGKDYFPTIW